MFPRRRGKILAFVVIGRETVAARATASSDAVPGIDPTQTTICIFRTRRFALAVYTYGQIAERGAAKDGCEGWKAWSIHHLEASASHLHETGDEAVRLEGSRLRASTATDHSDSSFRSNDSEGLHARGIERKQSAFILQKGHALKRLFKRNLVRVGVVEWNRRDRLLTIEPAKLYGRTKDAATLFVQHGHGQFAASKASLQGLGRHQLGEGHLQIQSAVCGRDPIVSCRPVGHQDALEAPVIAQNVFFRCAFCVECSPLTRL